MKSNPTKCKELIIRKKSCTEIFPVVAGIPQTPSIVLLGVTFQEDSRFTIHVYEKLKKANKCLFILRSLRKEGYNQKEIDHLFTTLVLPNITYAVSVYGASKPELAKIEYFLRRCHKRKYISKEIRVQELLEKQDRKLFSKVRQIEQHPLRNLLPKKKVNRYELRNKFSNFPKINTDRFKNSYINRLIFKYNLVL
ncbi:uncharacterized protein LOC114537971 [Dendronephthya gigantea]|uniref:uncharacterized protein LOC114537971 n=1 Tax=Dendronephthya gigantea TaxID=151771 RepID=UPI00106B1AEC|nr:uncharacterized protein LOC114537971 [Dendronephthya gigantea]